MNVWKKPTICFRIGAWRVRLAVGRNISWPLGLVHSPGIVRLHGQWFNLVVWKEPREKR